MDKKQKQQLEYVRLSKRFDSLQSALIDTENSIEQIGERGPDDKNLEQVYILLSEAQELLKVETDKAKVEMHLVMKQEKEPQGWPILINLDSLDHTITTLKATCECTADFELILSMQEDMKEVREWIDEDSN